MFASRPTSEAIRFKSCAIFSGETRRAFAASQVEYTVSQKSCSSRFGPILNTGRNRPRTVQEARHSARFLKKGTAIATRTPWNASRLHFRHSGFDAQVPGLAIRSNTFARRLHPRGSQDSFLSKSGSRPNDCLRGKIRNDIHASHVPPDLVGGNNPLLVL